MITIHRKNGLVTEVYVDQIGKQQLYAIYSILFGKYEKAKAFMNNEKEPAENKLLQVPRLVALQDEIASCLFLLKLAGEDWEVHRWLK